MSRSARLLDLLQLLRRHRRPVAGVRMAEELGVSLRTLYRDIATLQAQGAPIDGAPGLGYQLRQGFTLPPLMFSTEELEALVLGSRWVAQQADKRLALAARDALAKIAAVLPPPLRREAEDNTLLVVPSSTPGGDAAAAVTEATLAQLRDAIRSEGKLAIAYRDVEGRSTERVIWPVALGYFDRVQVVVAWCELRQDIRHFRTDRIGRLAALDERYPVRRQALVRQWREREGLPPL